MRNFSIKNTRWISPGHEFDYIASIILKENNRFYLVGNRKEVDLFYNRVGKYLCSKFVGVILTEYLDCKEINGIPIIDDTAIKKDDQTIVICNSFDRNRYVSVRELFCNYGFEENVDFFQGEVFSMVYEVYALDTIILDRIEIFTTSVCSLKCKHCIAYIPYFDKPKIVPLDTLKSDADLLFQGVDGVNKLKVLGGEGLAYPYLCEYLEYVCKKYRNKIGSIRIGTNGTIIPAGRLLDICKLYNITMDISDYTVAIGDKSKLNKIKEICENAGVNVDVKRTGEQWLDLGFPNNLPPERNETELRSHFHRCAMFCRDFYNGKLYYCCSNYAAIQSGMFEENANDSFDLRNTFTKKELLEYEIGYSKLGHTTFCAVCRGCSEEVNPYHVEVARQL